MRQVVLDSPHTLTESVAAVGTFDGVHEGHAAVLGRVMQRATALECPSVAVTFDPHPLCVVAPERAPRVLTTLDEKAWRIERLGLDVLAVVRFTPEVRNLPPEAFIKRYLVGMLGVREMVVGYDHGFGRDRSGNLETVRRLGGRLGFSAVGEQPTLIDGAPVSSTRIRTCVMASDFDGARRLLGGGYPVAGRVVAGDGRGRKLGYPTANVASADPSKLLPPDGVYAAWVHTPQPWPAVVNLGNRPTFNGHARALEAHLMDFDGDLYDHSVVVEFEHRLRAERRFQDPEALVEQIEKDCREARAFLSKQASTLLRR